MWWPILLEYSSVRRLSAKNNRKYIFTRFAYIHIFRYHFCSAIDCALSGKSRLTKYCNCIVYINCICDEFISTYNETAMIVTRHLERSWVMEDVCVAHEQILHVQQTGACLSQLIYIHICSVGKKSLSARRVLAIFFLSQHTTYPPYMHVSPL